MIELRHNALVFTFPEVHPKARLTVGFQRTLRIPDDGRDYPLPAGLGLFPVRHVDDHAARLPASWVERGGVMLPMWRAEAMWLNFDADYVEGHGAQYPFAIKIAAGKVNAVTGEGWRERLNRTPQDYMVAPEQPWLDGFCVERGVIRQFVAMPLSEGYTAEEQVAGHAEFGGLQIVAYPMQRAAFERRFPKRPAVMRRRAALSDMDCCLSAPAGAMGMGLGGRMRQEIAEDPYDVGEWEHDVSSRCFVHLVDAGGWRRVTGEAVPTKPPTAWEYTRAGMPWFDYYDEAITPVAGSSVLRGLKSVLGMGREKEKKPLPPEETVVPTPVVKLRAGLKKGQVREGHF